VGKTFQPYEPRQAYLLPPSPQEWLPKDHLAYFVLDLVGTLDLRGITRRYESELRGYPPHDPRMMVALLVYGYCVGVRASRQIEKKTHEDIAFRMLAGDNHPDHTRVSEFRRIHLAALAGLFLQILRLCQKAGLVKLGHVAIDGTKVKANASKHKAMSHDRMKEEEQRLKAVVDAMLRDAEAVDAEDDARYGKDKRGGEMPDDLRDPRTRLARIQQLRAELEAEANAQQASADDDDDDDDDDEPPAGADDLPSHQIQTEKDGTPKPKAQRNFTDGDSRIMKKGSDFMQAYNCQAAVDEGHQIIVAQAVTNQPPDVEHFVPILEQVARNCGEMPDRATADAGYYSEDNVAHALTQGVDVHIATGRRKHGESPPTVRGRPPRDLALKQWMARKLATKRGAAAYARRKAVVEPVFGQIKQARGIRDFLLRGIDKVRGEWALIAATHNLLKLFGATRTA
jgi:transposase